MLRPKHMFPSLATPGDITRNIVSATMFPSLARPLDEKTLYNGHLAHNILYHGGRGLHAILTLSQNISQCQPSEDTITLTIISLY